jgi:hypothetical protein
LHLTDRLFSDYRSSNPTGEEKAGLAFLNRYLINKGSALTPNGLGALSTRMTYTEIAALAGAVEAGLREWTAVKTMPIAMPA